MRARGAARARRRGGALCGSPTDLLTGRPRTQLSFAWVNHPIKKARKEQRDIDELYLPDVRARPAPRAPALRACPSPFVNL